MQSRKRRRRDPPAIHPNNRYAEEPPDFALLASLYPSFQPYVFTSKRGRPAIDFTDFNATRELTRLLLRHDHGVEWWIPDGQLCPTVPNRSNYVHWIADLLKSDVIPKKGEESDGKIRGFDIGTGTNCIYPLLGASIYGWSFVGSDVTEVALGWAKKNVENNPHLSELIEIRNAAANSQPIAHDSGTKEVEEVGSAQPDDAFEEEKDQGGLHSSENTYFEPAVLVGVVKDAEEFDFCMCNPPFFESIEEAGLNPKTACGGTHEEMVCPGGECAFITRIIEDSLALKHSFRWFTSMVGRKVNLKILTLKLRQLGVSVVKTTEFVQGQTARWGLAWSFMSPNKKSLQPPRQGSNKCSFILQGLRREFGAFQVLKATESFFLGSGAACKVDLASFSVKVTLSMERLQQNDSVDQALNVNADVQFPSSELCFRISIFEQIPGTILVKGFVEQKESPFSGTLSTLICNLEDSLKMQFVNKL